MHLHYQNTSDILGTKEHIYTVWVFFFKFFAVVANNVFKNLF